MPSTCHSDITDGLSQRPARISPKYFYDQRGSQLFEAITRLPEYYPTRTETALMQRRCASGALPSDPKVKRAGACAGLFFGGFHRWAVTRRSAGAGY